MCYSPASVHRALHGTASEASGVTAPQPAGRPQVRLGGAVQAVRLGLHPTPVAVFFAGPAQADDQPTAVLAELQQIQQRLTRVEAAVGSRLSNNPAL